MAGEFLTRAFVVSTALLQLTTGSLVVAQPTPVDQAAHNRSPAGHPRAISTASPARAVAVVEDLRSQLRAANSATAVLDRWCASHGMAPAGTVVADKITEGSRPVSPAVRRLLRVGANEPLVFRHVRLRCQDHVLSDALLWYVPGRLPSAMNEQLLETNIPFGRVIGPLDVRRRELSARRTWRSGRVGAASGEIPVTLFYQTALLILPDGAPIAYVREEYMPGVLEFPAP
jgi:chorismate-pyruvate lyase